MAKHGNPEAEGYHACIDERLDDDDNPYPADTREHQQWRTGWYAAKYEGIEY